jgi:hypothetical protein
VFSLWVGTSLIVLMALEVPSATGRTLEKLGADVVAGWLVQLVLISLLIDAFRGTLPRAVSLAPVAFYGSYYYAFWQQGVHVALASENLRRSNPGKIVAYDPKLHSLVMDQADVFVATHVIPVAYQRDSSYVNEGYISYRLIETDTVKEYLRHNADGVQILSVEWDGSTSRNVRELRIAQRPEHKPITVSVHDVDGNGWSDWNIGSSITSLNVDGNVIGQFKSSYVRKLFAVPFFTIGCKFFSKAPTRKCQAEFATERVQIESRPDSVDRTLYPDPVSIMTEIRRRSLDEIIHFRNSDFGPDLTTRAPTGEDAAFDALQDIINGRSPTLSWKTGSLIASNPSRLAPYAVPMTKRFLDLRQNSAVDASGRLQQISVLAAGIEALEPAEFSAVQDLLSEFARKNSGVQDEYPLLYVRLADAGPKMYSIYRDQFLAQDATIRAKLLAVVAICRIGQADSELVSAIDSERAKLDAGGLNDDNYQTALFVALLKFGQGVANKPPNLLNHQILKGWYEAVLSGKGRTDVGPNNCMPLEWPEDGYIPAVLAPSLKWVNERWVSGG